MAARARVAEAPAGGSEHRSPFLAGILGAGPEDSARNELAEYVELALDQIVPSPLNPRQDFAEEGLQELAESIKAVGILEPLVVRLKDNTFEIVAGERRWRASTLAGLGKVPVRVLYGLDDETTVRLMLVENLQRRDLNPIEEARGYARLQETGMKEREIAAAVNRSQPSVSNRLRLLELPEDVQARINRGTLTAAHGVAILRFRGFPSVMSRIGDLAASKKTSTDELERGVPFEYQLGEHVVHISDSGFIGRNCSRCLRKAWKGSKSYGTCLSPDHYAELLAQEKREEEEALAAAIAQTGTAPEEMPKMATLDARSFRVLLGNQTPKKCLADCPKRRQAVSWNNKDLVEMCTDVACHTRMLAEDSERRERRRLAQMKAVAEAVHRIAAGAEMDARGLAVLCAEALCQKDWGMVRDVFAGQGVDFDAVLRMKDKAHESHIVYNFARNGSARLLADAVPVGAMFSAMLEILLLNDVQQMLQGYGGDYGNVVKWFLGDALEAALQVGADGGDDAEEAVGCSY